MSIDSWSVGDDFADVVDTLEPIRLAYPGQGLPVDTIQAWRFSESRCPVEGIGLLAEVVETTWQFHLGPAETPRVGGTVADAGGACSTIVDVRRMGDRTRWRCVVRRVVLSPDSKERLSIRRAQWQTTQDGPAISGWTTEPPAVAGVVRRDGDTGATATDPPQPRVVVALTERTASVGDRISAERSGLIEVIEVLTTESSVGPTVVAGRLVPALT